MGDAVRRYTVYVVEDNHQLRDSLRWLLEGAGYRVTCFAGADEFLGACDAGGRCCLITDVVMPGMDGLDLLREMAQRALNIPSIVMTAYDSRLLRERVAAAGASGYLCKPFEANELLAYLGSLSG